ncbi:hypothetical protein BIW11_10152 [Tropilaelaps mercedesae]|uniref:Uncharacterized protein n=1 Tax=Tropilaelaps mercedesae TaxID=418985 RepID=A0A1V9XGY9_9ACAR|nr:hypothetical protein BIW11_10152 [Tropilaelaps mercedesae]
MEQQIVLVTHDGEYHVQELQPVEDGTEMVHVEEAEPDVQIENTEGTQEDVCHETLKEIAAESINDLNLECEEEELGASPGKLMDRARLVNYPVPDPRQKRRMDRESSMMLAELVNLPTPVILEKLRQLENLAHILRQQEMNELTRAEVLNIL